MKIHKSNFWRDATSMCVEYSPLICALLLIIGTMSFSIIYDIILGIMIGLGAVILCIKKIVQKQYLWSLAFIVIALLYNPYIPLFLVHKSRFFLFDILIAIIFLIEYVTPDPKSETIAKVTIQKTYTRDKIY